MEGTSIVENQINDLRLDLKRLIEKAEQRNAQGESTRSRQLSLAITALEEAKHWLRDIVDKE